MSKDLTKINEFLDEIISKANKVKELLSQEAPKEAAPEALPTFEDVRQKLMEVSRAGHNEEVKELIKKYGYKKLSEVPENLYPALLEEAGKING